MSKLKIVGILILIVGIGLIAYPTISNMIQQHNSTKLIQEYENSVSSMSDEDMNSTISAIESYNENIKDNSVQDIDYISDMFIDGFIGYIDIPKIDVYLPIYKGTSDFVLENGIGHVSQTSLPYGGLGTHCVLTGHTGLAENRLFTDIDKLETGDMFYIHILGETHAYQVDNITVVLPSEIKSFEIDHKQDYITLMTCTPYGINSHRLLVRGSRVDFSDGVLIAETEADESKINQLPTSVNDRQSSHNTKMYICLSVALLVIVLALIFVITKKYKRRQSNDK